MSHPDVLIQVLDILKNSGKFASSLFLIHIIYVGNAKGCDREASTFLTIPIYSDKILRYQLMVLNFLMYSSGFFSSFSFLL